MKRFVVLGVCCLVLAVATSVKADLLPVTDITVAYGTVNVGSIPTPQVFSISITWDTGPELYDIVKVYFTRFPLSGYIRIEVRLSGVGGNLYVPTGR